MPEYSDKLQPVLEVKKLSKRLSGKLILSDINVTLYPGEIYGFLGPNGSGKTTTIKLILGLLSMERGEIIICGHDIRKEFEAAIANVGGIIENPEMYKQLTGRQNLMQYLRMYDNLPESRVDEVTKIVHLEERINDRINKYSLGMRQRLGVAQAILNYPKLLVLDEPTNGLDPAGIRELRDILRDLAANHGVTVFVSSHLLSELELMCDRVGIIDRGVSVGERNLHDLNITDSEGKYLYTFEVDDKVKAAEVAGAQGIMFRPDSEKLLLSVHIERENVPAFVSALVSAGVGVYGIIKQKKSLEDAFLEMTHWNTPGASVDAGMHTASVNTPTADAEGTIDYEKPDNSDNYFDGGEEK